MFGIKQFLFIIIFLPTFRWFPRNTVTLTFHQSLVEFGGTCRMPMHVMNSPTPVRQTERLNWPIRTWPSDWANEHQPSSVTLIIICKTGERENDFSSAVLEQNLPYWLSPAIFLTVACSRHACVYTSITIAIMFTVCK